MPLSVTCTGCKKVYALPETMRGKKVRCKECQAMFMAEAATDVTAAATAPKVATMAATCPSCRAVYQLPATMTGKQVRCKKCQATFVIGKTVTAAPAPTKIPVGPAGAVDDELLIAQARERVRAKPEGQDTAALSTIHRPAAAATRAGGAAGGSTAVRHGTAPVGGADEDVVEDVEEDAKPARKVRSVKIASDLDGSPQPKRFPVAVISVLGGISFMTLMVLALLIGGGFVLAGKLQAMAEKGKIAQASATMPKDLTEAVKMLKSADATKRANALKLIEETPMDDARRNEVAEGLDSAWKKADNDSQRLTVLKLLDSWGTQRNVGNICDAARSNNKEICAAAMTQLGKFKDKRCYDALSERLKDADTRSTAEELLMAAGTDAEAALLPRLDKMESNDTILSACKVARKIGGNQSKRKLEALLKTPFPAEMRSTIQETLKAVETRAKQK